MANAKLSNRKGARRAFVVGRAAYEHVAAVEGLSLSCEARALFAQLDEQYASPAERLVSVITANSSPRAVHVVPHAEGWAVRAAGTGKAVTTCATLDEAVALARAHAKANKGELLVHGRDGRLLRRATFASLA